MRDRIRVTRVIVHEGDRAWVEETLEKSIVHKGGILSPDRDNTVREVAIGIEVLS